MAKEDKFQLKQARTNAGKTKMLAALSASMGVIHSACKATGIPRQRHYDWMVKDPLYKQTVEEIDQSMIDFAEAKLLNLINKGDAQATIFLLKTKGRGRGYGDQMELRGITEIRVVRE